MRKRLQDVAEAAGCSLSVASRILNKSNKSDIRFSKELAKKVRRVADEIGYGKLVSEAPVRKGTIAVVSQSMSLKSYDIPSSCFLQNLTFKLSEEGYDFTYIPREAEDLNERVKALYNPESRIRGLIILHYSYLCDFLDFVKNRDLPYVVVNSGEILDNNCVIPDDDGACFQMAKFLRACRHQKISYISHGTTHVSGEARLEGIKKHCHENGIDIVDVFKYSDLTPEKLKENIEKGTRAFVTYFGDHRLRALVEMIRNLGYGIPDDISVATLSDLNVPERDYSLVHTYIPFREMADIAASKLKSMIEKETRTFKNIVVPEYLVIGDSCRAL